MSMTSPQKGSKSAKVPLILIKNATILSLDDDLGVKHNCDILVSGDKIAAVAPKLPHVGVDEIIDATDCIVTPGFVNTHQHCWQQILRGVGTDWHLVDYFQQMRRIYSGAFTAEDVYMSNYVAALDLMDNGVTTVLDHCHILNTPNHTDAAIRGLKDAGIRGTFCYGFYQNPSNISGAVPGQDMFDLAARKLDATRAFTEFFSPKNDPADDLLTFGGAPAELEIQTIPQISEEINFFRRLGARLITGHIGHGTCPSGRTIEELGLNGLLGRDLVLSHCAFSTSQELGMVKRSKVNISATPETELQMGMGHPIAFRAKDKKINIGLGLDVTCSNSNDMFFAMRLLIQAERGRHEAAVAAKATDARPIKVARKSIEAFEMATIGGAKAMHLDHLIGTISLGKRADLVVTRCDSLNMTPFTDPVGSLMFHAHPGNIDSVLVNGKIMKRSGQLVGIDWPYLRQEIRQRTARIQQAYMDAKRAASGTDADGATVEHLFSQSEHTTR